MNQQLKFFLLPCLVFAGLFLSTGSLNRPATDDFEFMSKLSELGFNGSVQYFYNNWNTRWMAVSLMNVVLFSYQAIGNFFIFHLVSLILLWYAFYRLTMSFIFVRPAIRSILAGFLVITFFHACFSVPDVFFWVNTSVMYLYGCIACIFALAAILSPSRGAVTLATLVVCGLFIGGSYEPLVFTLLVCGATILVYMFTVHGGRVIARPPVLKTIILLAVLMIAFAISYAGEGHLIRASFLPQTTVGFKILVLLKSILKLLVLYLPWKLLQAFLFALPFVVVGAWTTPERLTFRIVIRAFIALLVLCIISLVPLVFIMSEMGPERAWTQISLYVTFFAILLAAYLGKQNRNRLIKFKFFPFAGRLLALVLLIEGLPAIKTQMKYVSAYEKRMEKLIELKMENNTATTELDPLPSSGWLHSAEITIYEDHFTNRHLKNYLGLDFNIAVKNESAETKN